MEKEINIQEIIKEKSEEILDIIKNELGQANQEPDFVIMRELGEYFK